MVNAILGKPTFQDYIDVIRDFFSVDFNEYEYGNLPVSSVALERIRIAVIAAFLGIIVAVIYSLVNRKIFGDFIHSLGNENAFSPEKAVTLAELGYYRNPAVRSAIRGGNTYKGILRCPEQDEFNTAVELRRGEYEANAARNGQKVKPFKAAKFHFDFENNHFYIPEDQAFSAETKFRKKNGSIPGVILVVIISFAALFLALKLLPELIQLANNFVGMLGK